MSPISIRILSQETYAGIKVQKKFNLYCFFGIFFSGSRFGHAVYSRFLFIFWLTAGNITL